MTESREEKVATFLHQGGFTRGLHAASEFLMHTAEDYEQSANQLTPECERPGIFPNSQAAAKHARQILREKAQLLRGQAEHILNLTES